MVNALSDVNQSFPTADDRKLWDLHLSGLAVHALTVGDELKLFDELEKRPATADEIAQRLQINRRASRALLALLASTELLVQRAGRYQPSETARNFLLTSSPYYWGQSFRYCVLWRSRTARC